MRLAPEAPADCAGQVVAIVLDRVGDKVFHYERLRKAMWENRPLAPLRGVLLPGEGSPPDANRVRGALVPDLLSAFEGKRGFVLDLEQRQALAAMNCCSTPIFHVHALAGVGKTALARAVLYCLSVQFWAVDDDDSAALLLLPSRELREDLGLELMSGE